MMFNQILSYRWVYMCLHYNVMLIVMLCVMCMFISMFVCYYSTLYVIGRTAPGTLRGEIEIERDTCRDSESQDYCLMDDSNFVRFGVV